MMSVGMFVNRYGEEYIEKYDVIEEEEIDALVLEIGTIIPKQIKSHVEGLCKVYRGLDLAVIRW